MEEIWLSKSLPIFFLTTKKKKEKEKKEEIFYSDEGLIVGVECGSCGSDSATDATTGPRSRGRRHA